MEPWSSASNSFLRLIYASVFILLLATTCTKNVQDEQLLYFNDFESGSMDRISNAVLDTFKQTRVLGRYNKSGFKLDLNNLPPHQYIKVSFDLNIHDSWDGNYAGQEGPDFWKMNIDGKPYFTTTFVNRPCNGYDCASQSYPAEYPFNNYARTTAEPGTLRGACVLFNEPQGGSHYKFVKIIKHTGNTLTIECLDELKQLNAAPDFQSCDESWSVDNIEIKTVKL